MCLGVLMIISVAYTDTLLQSTRALLQDARAQGKTLEEVIAAIDERFANRGKVGTVALCPECGATLQKMAVNIGDGSVVEGDYTYALMCTNRPAKDRPWIDGMCGYVEYI